MEILAIVGLITAAFAALAASSVAFGADSRESFDPDPNRASNRPTTLRYV